MVLGMGVCPLGNWLCLSIGDLIVLIDLKWLCLFHVGGAQKIGTKLVMVFCVLLYLLWLFELNIDNYTK